MDLQTCTTGGNVPARTGSYRHATSDYPAVPPCDDLHAEIDRNGVLRVPPTPIPSRPPLTQRLHVPSGPLCYLPHPLTDPRARTQSTERACIPHVHRQIGSTAKRGGSRRDNGSVDRRASHGP